MLKLGNLMLKITSSAVIAVSIWFGSGMAAPMQANAATEESLALLSFGKEFVGTPYLFGATSGLTSAFDCSSFVQYIYSKQGLTLPRTSSAQAAMGQTVIKSNLSVGDLVFFHSDGNWIGHVAVYAGNGQILHASSSSGVTVSKLDSAYWKARYVTAKRLL